MKITASDPDIETLVARITRKEINLRPDFQRGEVWSEAKRQRLIDTILRGWQMPPIHVVAIPDSQELEVLDGQQRLAAIRDFSRNELTIDGQIAPWHAEISMLGGKAFSRIGQQWQRRFNQYPVRVFTITEYAPDEPYELFFRLNQPTTLTAAEQRNAFFGPARGQIKHLVELAKECGLSKERIGFSNARMAYDDVLARACMFREACSFNARVTAGALADQYRSKVAFQDSTVHSVEDAIRFFALGLISARQPMRLNKATFLSWLLFCCDNRALSGVSDLLADVLDRFSEYRQGNQEGEVADGPLMRALLRFYADRSSSRVNDTLSVAARDFVLWVFFAHVHFNPNSPDEKLRMACRMLNRLRGSEVSRLDLAAFVQHLMDTDQWRLRP